MTTADRMLFGSAENHASQQSLRGLDWLNLFLAGVLTGFGPFVALYLAGRSWTKVEIGLVLTVSGLTGLLIQVPGGELLDVVRSKRSLVALGVATIACAALILALWPSFTPVLIAEVLLGMTGGFLGPAVAAISLGLVGNDGLPERLGRNQRFAAIGGFGAAALMGLLGYLFSNQAIFFASAALAFPTLVALGRIRADDIHFARACGAPMVIIIHIDLQGLRGQPSARTIACSSSPVASSCSNWPTLPCCHWSARNWHETTDHRLSYQHSYSSRRLWSPFWLRGWGAVQGDGVVGRCCLSGWVRYQSVRLVSRSLTIQSC
jgi:MFS family permease